MASTAPVIMGVRCHNCSRFRPPSEVIAMGDGGVRICERCYHHHQAAMKLLCDGIAERGTKPPECASCGATVDVRSPVGDKRMYLVQADGVLALFCRMCHEAYERKRSDLFRETRYGREKGIA